MITGKGTLASPTRISGLKQKKRQQQCGRKTKNGRSRMDFEGVFLSATPTAADTAVDSKTFTAIT